MPVAAFLNPSGQPVDVSAANPLPTTAGGGGGAATIADGADVAEGAVADAIVAAGAAGTVSAKLRRATQGLEDLKTQITPTSGTTGGADPKTFLSDASTKTSSWKTSAGTLYALSMGNTNALPCYVRVYNKASAATTSDTPVLRYMVPGSATGGGREASLPTFGIVFSLGIQLRITTGAADNDDTAAAANEVTVSGAVK